MLSRELWDYKSPVGRPMRSEFPNSLTLGLIVGFLTCFIASVALGQAPVRPGRTLNKVDILELLQGGVTSARAATIVQKRGIDFQPNEDYLLVLESLGAKPVLTKAVRKAAVFPVSKTLPTQSGTEDVKDSGAQYTVQVAASRAKEDAEALVKILKARDYPVFIVAPEYAHANDNLFRVQVGPFTSRDDGEKVRAKLAREGFKPFVRR